MTITVYVWNPIDKAIMDASNGNWEKAINSSASSSSAGGLGHASMQAGSSYISLWPAVEGKKKPYFASKDYDYDRYTRIQRKPEFKIQLKNLPDREVRRFWSTFDKPFDEIRGNCCHVVAKGLHIARDDYKSKNSSSSLSKFIKKTLGSAGANYVSLTGKVIWSPALVASLAYSLKLWSE